MFFGFLGGTVTTITNVITPFLDFPQNIKMVLNVFDTGVIR